MRQYIRLFNADGTVQDFARIGHPSDAPPGPVTKEEPSPPAPPRPQFREGDLVRYIGPVARADSIRYGGIGVVRDGEKSVGGSIGVEWAGLTGGHDLYGCTRHSRKSGWFVSPESIEHAT